MSIWKELANSIKRLRAEAGGRINRLRRLPKRLLASLVTMMVLIMSMPIKVMAQHDGQCTINGVPWAYNYQNGDKELKVYCVMSDRTQIEDIVVPDCIDTDKGLLPVRSMGAGGLSNKCVKTLCVTREDFCFDFGAIDGAWNLQGLTLPYSVSLPNGTFWIKEGNGVYRWEGDDRVITYCDGERVLTKKTKRYLTVTRINGLHFECDQSKIGAYEVPVKIHVRDTNGEAESAVIDEVVCRCTGSTGSCGSIESLMYEGYSAAIGSKIKLDFANVSGFDHVYKTTSRSANH